MSKKFAFKKKISAVVMAGLIATNLFGYTQVYGKQIVTTQQSSITSVQDRSNTQKNARYLDVYFGIKSVPDNITLDFLGKAMSKVSDKEISPQNKKEKELFLQAVKTAVIGAHFEELALTYPKSKIEDTLKDNGIKKVIDSEYAAYVACALDTGLITSEQVIKKEGKSVISKEEAINLLMAVADANGKTRNFIGFSNDQDIYRKLMKAREEFVLFENEKLQKIGEEAVMNKVTTGYNLLCSSYNANFIPELTLRYGHSTTIHATQLIGLLNSEGIVAKVQLEPKVSIFEYLPEWGDVPPATPDYRVQVINENFMLAHSLEYDLVLEFENQKDKLQFDTVVGKYAKKNDSNKDGEGLLFASWWQPLYVSGVEMQDGYKQIYDNVITDGVYSLHPFCLPEKKEDVLKGFKEINPNVQVSQVKIWCNDAFFRYLNQDYQ